VGAGVPLALQDRTGATLASKSALTFPGELEARFRRAVAGEIQLGATRLRFLAIGIGYGSSCLKNDHAVRATLGRQWRQPGP